MCIFEIKSFSFLLNHSDNRRKYILLIGFSDIPTHNHLINNEMSLLYIEHDIQFTHILEILIQGLHQIMDELQKTKFIHILIVIYSNNEI